MPRPVSTHGIGEVEFRRGADIFSTAASKTRGMAERGLNRPKAPGVTLLVEKVARSPATAEAGLGMAGRLSRRLQHTDEKSSLLIGAAFTPGTRRLC